MAYLIRSTVVAMLLAGSLADSQALAEGEGQADLDRATELKLAAKNIDDLTEVLRLLDSALDKGLDEEHTQFANSLLASTLIQRGSVVAKVILGIVARSLTGIAVGLCGSLFLWLYVGHRVIGF